MVIQAKNSSINGRIFLFSTPTILENLLLSMAGVFSTALVGTLGTTAFAAASISVTMIEIFRAVFSGLTLGATVAVAKQSDAAIPEQIAGITLHILGINALLGIGFGLLLGKNTGFILNLLFRKAPDVIHCAEVYLKIASTAVPFLAIDISISGCLRGKGDVKTPFYITAAVNVIQLLLGCLFIFVLQMDMQGAAAAYAVSIIVGALCKIYLLLFWKKSPIQIRHLPTLSMTTLRDICTVGLPSVFEQLMTKLAFLGMQIVTALISVPVLAGYNAANSFLRLIYCVTQGIETTQVVLVNQCVGNNEIPAARKYAYRTLVYTEILTIGISIFAFLATCPIIRFFCRGGDPETLQHGAHILRIMLFTVPLTSCFQGSQGVLKGCSDVKVIALGNVLGPWLLRIPMAYLLISRFEFGIYGLIIACFTDYLARALVYYLTMKKEHWITERID